MLKAIAFGLAVGSGIQAWRNWPADGPVTQTAGALVLVVAVVCAFLGGRAVRRPSSAVAVASAEATAVAAATNTVNLAVVVPEAGRTASTAAGAVRVPDESAPWIVGPRGQLEADQLDGYDWRDMVAEDDAQGHEL